MTPKISRQKILSFHDNNLVPTNPKHTVVHNGVIDYFCRKQKYTVNTQAVVGAGGIFLDVVTGFPGSINDARVLPKHL